MRIEDYALIGDQRTCALVGRNGSIDWLCLPRLDSGASFAALLGDEANGRWLIEPAGETKKATRRYRRNTPVLVTEFETEDGVARVTDCMLMNCDHPVVVRVVEGVKGTVEMRTQLVIRPDYGSTVPWVEHAEEGITLLAGPNAYYLRTPIETRGEDYMTIATFKVR